MAFAGSPHSIKEFRIVLPLECEEYHIGQLWSVAEASKQETGGGDGVEVISNESFGADYGNQPDIPLMAEGKTYTTGQYTHKIYHLSQKVPAFIRLLAPTGSLEVHEKAWNAYPYCRTVITNPYMAKNFYIVIESFHANDDTGDNPNVHNLSGRDLEKRVIVNIDIANERISPKDYKSEWDPTLVRSEKANRGPLPADKTGAWKKNTKPVMCCYKLVKVFFKWWGLQNKVENFILKSEQRLFCNFHRQVVCWLDHYYGKTIEDIRKLEDETKDELEKQRFEAPLRGMSAKDEK